MFNTFKQHSTPSQSCIILTRPWEQSQKVLPDYQHMGCPVICSPCLAVEHLTPPSLPEILTKTSSPTLAAAASPTIIITSQYAISALLNVSVNVPVATPIFCVGEATAHQIRALGFHKTTWAATAAALYQKIKTTIVPGTTFIYLAGSDITFDFSTVLPQCVKHVVYETAPAPRLSEDVLRALDQTQTAIFPLYSARSAKIVYKLLISHGVDLEKIIFVGLSPTVIEGLGIFSHKRPLVLTWATEPTHQSMLAQVQTVLS